MDKNKFRFLKNNIRFFQDCTLLLVDDDNHSKIFISDENKYCTKYSDNKSTHVKILNEFKDIRKSYEIDVIDLTDNYYKIDISDIKKYCTILLIDDDNYNKIFISEKNIYCIRYNDDDVGDDDDCDKSVYYKILNDFERFVSVKNNIVNLINNNKHNHKITLLVDDIRMFICGKRQIFLLLNYELSYIL